MSSLFLRQFVSTSLVALSLSFNCAHATMSVPGQFSVAENGAATYSIPLQLPPGTAGMEPKISLNYNSMRGNGIVGMGWSIEGMSSIARCPRTMAQDGVRGAVNYDFNDRYCLDGQRLVAVSGAYGANGTIYRTERDQYSKIVSYGQVGKGPAWFKVWTKSGQIMEYGNTADARIEAAGRTEVNFWAQNQVCDTKSNCIVLSYTEDAKNGSFYPQSIQYTKNVTLAKAPFNTVEFLYEARGDDYAAGSASAVRLAKIQAKADGILSREYQLAYEQGPTTQRSRLVSVKSCGASACLATTTFTWDGTVPAIQNWQHDGNAVPWVSELGDIFGDGLEVAWGNAFTLHFATKISRDGTSQKWQWNDGQKTGMQGNLLVDLFGTGRKVFYQTTYNNHRATELNADGTRRNFQWDGHNFGGVTYAADGWQFVDLFGDGRQIFWTHAGNIHYAARLNANRTIEKWQWNGHGIGSTGWQFANLFGDGRQVYWTHSGSTHYATRLNADGTVQNWQWNGHGVGTTGWKLVDLFGDGRQVYWTHSGTTHFATRLNEDGTVQNWQWNGHGKGTDGWQFADLFGDGRQVYWTHSGSTHYATRLNANGTTQSWTWTGHGVGTGGWKMGHLFGDGRQVYWTVTERTHFVTSFMPAAPDQLLGISSGIGDSLVINYKPMTDGSVYVKDNDATGTQFDLRLPLFVVSSVSSSNGIGGSLTTTYRYGGLKGDRNGRGLLGFRWTEAKQLESGMTTYSEYLQDWPYTGLLSVVKKSLPSGGNAGLISETQYKYHCQEPNVVDSTTCTVAPGKRYFPFLYQLKAYGWDLNGVALPDVITTNDYDEWGNATRVTVRTGTDFVKATSNVYLPADETNWILGRLTRSMVNSTRP